MNNRKPDYIKIYNTIVDLSQITTIEQGYGVDLTIRMYTGKDVAFTFSFGNQYLRDMIMHDIEKHIINNSNDIDNLMEDKSEKEEQSKTK